tara:strand:- start:9036 stop:10010 length:975 start_codon:yes stop_codon:yes gene_type:complete
MVHKYRLVKIYPGSPTRLGIIWSDSVLISLYGKLPDNNTHWEEVIEKDYEIISYTNTIVGGTYTIGVEFLSNTGYRKFAIHDLNAYNSITNNLVYVIKSFKRLSDGEIFTVGDKVKTSVDKSFCSIYNLEVIANKLIIDCTHSYLANKENINLLLDIQHIKKPLFTTEDGVDINNLDSVYYIRNRWLEHKDYFIYHTTATKGSVSTGHLYFSKKQKAYDYILLNKPKKLFTTEDGVDVFEGDVYYSINNILECSTQQAIIGTGGAMKDKLFKDFSTKEAAEKYILLNKPCLSINDVKLSLDKSKKYQYHNTTFINLIKLVKTKL